MTAPKKKSKHKNFLMHDETNRIIEQDGIPNFPVARAPGKKLDDLSSIYQRVYER